MTKNTVREILIKPCMILIGLALLAAPAAAQTTTTSKTKGTPTTTTRVEKGTVQAIEGNTVVVKMSTGQTRTVTVDPSRTAMIDGKEATVRDLKVGTALTATYTTTTTPVMDRTVTVASGTIWHVSGNTVIANINGENKQFNPKPDQKFNINGQMVDVYGLKKGMVFSAEKVVEEPSVQIATNTAITVRWPSRRRRKHRLALQPRRRRRQPLAGVRGRGCAGGGAAGGASTKWWRARQAAQDRQPDSVGRAAGPAVHWRGLRFAPAAPGVAGTARLKREAGNRPDRSAALRRPFVSAHHGGARGFLSRDGRRRPPL
jgi:hypothetical protein